jgi:hypothetical protein
MGTIFEQPVRKWASFEMTHVDNLLNEVTSLSKKHNITPADVLKAYEVMEMSRTNDLYVNNGNIHDEQMKGIGELLLEVSHSLQGIALAIENNK